MSESLARTIRLIKAETIRGAASDLLRELLILEPQSAFEQNYNYAINDAVIALRDMAQNLEDQL